MAKTNSGSQSNRKLNNNAGRPAKFGARMERQISIGIDAVRDHQLTVLRVYFQSQTPVGTVSESDVMRKAFDNLVESLEKEVPALKQSS